MLELLKSIFRSPINSWADLADEVSHKNYEIPPPPKPPLTRVLCEHGSRYTCRFCQSSIKTNWYGKKLGCLQPECHNFYGNKK